MCSAVLYALNLADLACTLLALHCKGAVTMKKLIFALFDAVLGFGRLLEAGREELTLDD